QSLPMRCGTSAGPGGSSGRTVSITGGLPTGTAYFRRRKSILRRAYRSRLVIGSILLTRRLIAAPVMAGMRRSTRYRFRQLHDRGRVLRPAQPHAGADRPYRELRAGEAGFVLDALADEAGRGSGSRRADAARHAPDVSPAEGGAEGSGANDDFVGAET